MSNSLNLLIKYRDYLKKIFPHLRGYIINKELIFKTNSNKILNFLTFLKNHTNSQYKVLSDICAVDFPQKENRFEVVYNLLSIAYNSRITIIVPTNESTPISSCVSIYSAAG
jgi:NADH:ubiquinone oxidoreductase subunit C